MILHLLLGFIPHSVAEWLVGPPQVAFYESRFEVITVAKQPVPRFVTSSSSELSGKSRKSIVPPEHPPRYRPTAADTVVKFVLTEPSLLVGVFEEDQVNENLPEETGMQNPADSSALVQAYISTVLGRVRSRRRYPEIARRMGQQGEILLAFTINRRGQLDGEIELLNSCPHSLLNRSARRSVERSVPFPPPPSSVLNASLPLKIKLLYRLTD
ncbi:TonB family protein [Gemmatimonadota bacterium]